MTVRPGDRLFAFCLAGWSVAGDHEALTGVVSAPDAAAARSKAAEGLAAADLLRHERAPATGRRLWVWEVPAAAMRAALGLEPEGGGRDGV